MNRINIKTSLKTNEDEITFLGVGEFDNNQIKFRENDVLVTIQIEANKLELVRKNDDYEMQLFLSDENSSGTYNINKLGILDLNIKTNNIKINNNKIELEYVLNIEGNAMGTFNYELEYEEII